MQFINTKNFMDKLSNELVPGNSIVVNCDGKEIFNYSSGYADYENKIPMTSQHLINIYSCTKVVTAVAVTQLLEKGLINLDDCVYEFIPEFKNMFVQGENGELFPAKTPITIRQLLTHTAGLSYNTKSEHIKSLHSKTNGSFSTLEGVKAIAKIPLLFEPGTAWRYSLGHDVLGGIIEVVSGLSYADYVKQKIFSPIGVNDIFFEQTDDVLDKMAEQYNYSGEDIEDIVQLQMSANNKEKHFRNVGKANSLKLSKNYHSSGAGIITTVRSFANFAQVLALGGEAPNGERILEPSSVDLIRTNQLKGKQLEIFSWEHLNGYGYGLGVRTLMDKKTANSLSSIGEFGWGGAAGATILVDPDKKLSFFYAHHMLNPQEIYYQPRIRNAVYKDFNG